MRGPTTTATLLAFLLALACAGADDDYRPPTEPQGGAAGSVPVSTEPTAGAGGAMEGENLPPVTEAGAGGSGGSYEASGGAGSGGVPEVDGGGAGSGGQEQGGAAGQPAGGASGGGQAGMAGATGGSGGEPEPDCSNGDVWCRGDCRTPRSADNCALDGQCGPACSSPTNTEPECVTSQAGTPACSYRCANGYYSPTASVPPNDCIPTTACQDPATCPNYAACAGLCQQ